MHWISSYPTNIIEGYTLPWYQQLHVRGQLESYYEYAASYTHEPCSRMAQEEIHIQEMVQMFQLVPIVKKCSCCQTCMIQRTNIYLKNDIFNCLPGAQMFPRSIRPWILPPLMLSLVKDMASTSLIIVNIKPQIALVN